MTNIVRFGGKPLSRQLLLVGCGASREGCVDFASCSFTPPFLSDSFSFQLPDQDHPHFTLVNTRPDNHLACERRCISGCHMVPAEPSDSRKYICALRLTITWVNTLPALCLSTSSSPLFVIKIQRKTKEKKN